MTNEEYLIGCLLVEESQIEAVNEIVTPDMFVNPICRDLYINILADYETNKRLDIARISANLEKTHKKKDIDYVLKNCLSVLTLLVDSAETYADLIRREYTAMELVNFIKGLSFKSVEIDDTIAEMAKKLDGFQKNQKVYITNAVDILNQYKGEMFTERKFTSTQTGIEAIDSIIDLEKKDVTILAARPSVGKSALALQIATTMAENGCKVGYFNLEMSEKQILERIIANKSGIPLVRVRKAQAFLNDEKEKFDKAVELITNNLKTLEIYSKPFNLAQLKAKCYSGKFDIVVVDYLQLIKVEDKESKNAEVSAISLGLKEMAMSLENHIIALSQMNRNKKNTDEPELSDLRDSGQIEQDASNVVYIWNIDEDGRTKGLKVAKARQGEVGKKALEFDGSLMTFKSMDGDFEDIVKLSKSFKRVDESNPFG